MPFAKPFAVATELLRSVKFIAFCSRLGHWWLKFTNFQAVLDRVHLTGLQILSSGVKLSPLGAALEAFIREGSSQGAPHGVASLKKWRKVVAPSGPPSEALYENVRVAEFALAIASLLLRTRCARGFVSQMALQRSNVNLFLSISRLNFGRWIWEVNFSKVIFQGASFAGKKSQQFRHKNSGTKFGCPKFISKNSTLNSGSGGAKSPVQTLVPKGLVIVESRVLVNDFFVLRIAWLRSPLTLKNKTPRRKLAMHVEAKSSD